MYREFSEFYFVSFIFFTINLQLFILFFILSKNALDQGVYLIQENLGKLENKLEQ